MTITQLKPVARRVDKVMVECGDPSLLFQFFTQKLGLPVAWALKDFGGMTSAGVAAGNVNLEFIRFKTARFGHPIDTFAPRTGNKIAGIAFEPEVSVDSALKELKKRELTHGEAHRATSWTDAVINGLFDAPDVAFFAEYHFDVIAWRKSLTEELAKSGGGPLGLVGVREIAVKLKAGSDCERFWKNFLSPTEENPPGCWSFPAGPRLRFIPAEENTIASMLVEVKSLDAAQGFLRENAMLGLSSDDRVLLQPSTVDGIQIFLAEKS